MDSVGFSLWLVYKLVLLNALFFSSGRACFFVVEDSEGELAPPLYPLVDLENLECTWILSAQEGKVIELTFEEVSLDDSTDEYGNCLDSITVYDGLTTQITSPFCGDGPPWPRFPIRLLSKTNSMSVKLVKKREHSRGFRAKFKHVSPRQEFVAVVNVEGSAVVLFDRLSDLSNFEKIPLIGSSSPSALSFDPIGKMFYFTDIGEKSIGRASLEDKSVNFIIEENVDVPLGIAVAYLTGLLYWTDAGRHEVSVSRLDGSFRKTLMTSSPECRSPKGIVLSRDNQHVFWTCEDRIEKAKADGSERNTAFVTYNVADPRALAIDTEGTYLYWIDSTVSKIQRIRVDGIDQGVVLTSRNEFLTQLHSLVLDEFAYFFTHTHDKYIYMVEREVDMVSTRFLGLEPPETLGGLYYYKSDMTIPAQHACTINNGGCTRLCFPDGTRVNCDALVTTTTTNTVTTVFHSASVISTTTGTASTTPIKCQSFTLDALVSECLLYTIVGLILLILCIIVLICISALCCWGCRRSNSREAIRRPSTQGHVFTVPVTKTSTKQHIYEEDEYVTIV